MIAILMWLTLTNFFKRRLSLLEEVVASKRMLEVSTRRLRVAITPLILSLSFIWKLQLRARMMLPPLKVATLLQTIA